MALLIEMAFGPSTWIRQSTLPRPAVEWSAERACRVLLFEIDEDELGDDLERLEDPDAVPGRRHDLGRPLGVQRRPELVYRQHVREIALVVLDHVRYRAATEAQLGEVL